MQSFCTHDSRANAAIEVVCSMRTAQASHICMMTSCTADSTCCQIPPQLHIELCIAVHAARLGRRYALLSAHMAAQVAGQHSASTTAQHRTTQHSTAQDDTAQHSTIRICWWETRELGAGRTDKGARRLNVYTKASVPCVDFTRDEVVTGQNFRQCRAHHVAVS